MSGQSPIVDQLGRLASLLCDYGRDEVWLQVTQLHPLSAQHDQVVVTVKDDHGATLRERSGRARHYTFRLDPSVPKVAVGHRFRVARDESGVHVEHVPTAANTGPRVAAPPVGTPRSEHSSPWQLAGDMDPPGAAT